MLLGIQIKSRLPVLLRSFTTSTPDLAINPSQLLRVCTVLYQQQNSSDLKLHSHLQNCNFHLTHEFFIQVCNKFPYSWKPIFRFFKFSQTQPQFTHTSITYNKIIDIFGKSKNLQLLWETLPEIARNGFATDKTFQIAVKSFASLRDLNKSVEIFHLMNAHNFIYNLKTLNKVVEVLCRDRLVSEAHFIVSKLKCWIKPSEETYKFLVSEYCREGDLIEASKVWNLMVDEGFEPGVEACEVMMETLFKHNKAFEALALFQSMRVKKQELGLSTYKIVIIWMCRQGKVSQAYQLLDEMTKRGVLGDNPTFAALIYGLGSKGRLREAYEILEGIRNPDVGVFHGLIKALLRLKRAGEATQLFRKMIQVGCEPTMHTYIMLLQAHLGKKGRKGPDPNVNFDTIFVGGLVKQGKSLDVTKFLERMIGGAEVPRFDYNMFLHTFSNEEGVFMFQEVGKRLREVGMVDLADIFGRFGEKMTTRERRRQRRVEAIEPRGAL